MAERQIEVESGKWRWSITRLRGAKRPSGLGYNRPSGPVDADPEAEDASADSDLPVLLLEDPDDNEHLMSATLTDDVSEADMSPDEVTDLARDPDWRQLPGPDGRIWRVEKMEKPEAVAEEARFERSANHVSISSDGGPERVLPLPEGVSLGTLTREQLVELVERGR
jgi:hypothetical protein